MARRVDGRYSTLTDRSCGWTRPGKIEHGEEQAVRLARLDRVDRLIRELAEHVDVLARPDPGSPRIGADEDVGQPTVHERLRELQCCPHLEVVCDGDLPPGAETRCCAAQCGTGP